MDHHGRGDLGLNLKLGSELVDHRPRSITHVKRNYQTAMRPCFELPLLSLGLGLDGGGGQVDQGAVVKPGVKGRDGETSGQSTVSSFSNSGLSVMRERSYEDEDYNCFSNDGVRKKLRLKKDQAQVLEERFKQQSTLNPKQKQALARQLNLSPRQVEVWFQNRRARTKLKQTELDYEYLKKCCETLTEENRRLIKELKELKALKQAQPNCVKLPAATLSICPSCECVTTTPARGGDCPSKSKFFNSAPSAAY
uniref:Homeobox domain-containing protein n=1 Tax=Kalanchoe fedtschenkoi TaxID=63787 RepID=A0A7N0ZVC6_KALFE